jgi:hypothetical protein
LEFYTIIKLRSQLIEVFDTILSHEDFKNDHDTIREAVGFKNTLNDFNFLFLLEVFNLIFEQTHIIFSILQRIFLIARGKGVQE